MNKIYRWLKGQGCDRPQPLCLIQCKIDSLGKEQQDDKLGLLYESSKENFVAINTVDGKEKLSSRVEPGDRAGQSGVFLSVTRFFIGFCFLYFYFFIFFL